LINLQAPDTPTKKSPKTKTKSPSSQKSQKRPTSPSETSHSPPQQSHEYQSHKTHKELRARIAELEEINAELEEKLKGATRLEKYNADLQEQLMDAEKEMDTLRMTAENLEAKEADSQRYISTLVDDKKEKDYSMMHDFKKREKEYVDANNFLTAKLRDAQMWQEDQNIANYALAEQFRKLQNALEEASHDCETYQDQILQLNQQIENQRNLHNKRIREDVEKQAISNRAYNEKILRLQDEVKQLKEKKYNKYS
jgi:hypothetical protein